VFLVIQGCPCNPLAAAYIALLAKDTHSTVNSIYRGQDAASILHRYGKHTQAELYASLPAGTANPPGRSTHELRSDGVSYQGPIGRKLEWWQQGFDVNDGDVDKLIGAASKHGWVLLKPYRAGVEFHHLNFASKPHPRNLKDRLRLIRFRLSLHTR